jgi:hypothetical protein
MASSSSSSSSSSADRDKRAKVRAAHGQSRHEATLHEKLAVAQAENQALQSALHTISESLKASSTSAPKKTTPRERKSRPLRVNLVELDTLELSTPIDRLLIDGIIGDVPNSIVKLRIPRYIDRDDVEKKTLWFVVEDKLEAILRMKHAAMERSVFGSTLRRGLVCSTGQLLPAIVSSTQLLQLHAQFAHTNANVKDAVPALIHQTTSKA